MVSNSQSVDQTFRSGKLVYLQMRKFLTMLVCRPEEQQGDTHEVPNPTRPCGDNNALPVATDIRGVGFLTVRTAPRATTLVVKIFLRDRSRCQLPQLMRQPYHTAWPQHLTGRWHWQSRRT